MPTGPSSSAMARVPLHDASNRLGPDGSMVMEPYFRARGGEAEVEALLQA